jgi:beta-glucuronidase
MQRRLITPSLIFLCLSTFGIADTSSAPAIANALGRPYLDLNGTWTATVDPYDTGSFDYRLRRFDRNDPPAGGFGLDLQPETPTDLVEYNLAEGRTLQVPGDWNSQAESLTYYEGSVWYRRTFDAPASPAGTRHVLYFGAANYHAEVFLNGRKIGSHVGGFTPFGFEVTGRLRQARNSLVVRVDNRRLADAVPGLMTDWWNYGGLTREVRLLTLPETFIADYSVQLDHAHPGKINISVQLDGPRRTLPVRFEIAELGVTTELQPDATGAVHARIGLKVEHWSPTRPRTYEISLVSEQDRVAERIGFRTIETSGSDILLNGEPVFLRGICLHEENPLRGGRAWSEDDARLLLGWARELGCNFVRLAHYPHNEHMARVADEIGLMLWEEIPVYWSIQWDNPDTLANARRQLAELIRRDRNRASVIVWSVANETPVTDSRMQFLRTLIEDARRLDGTRLVSAAMEMRGSREDPYLKTVNDPLGNHTDLVAFNQYIGWYEGMPDKCDQIEWRISYDKPVFVSEFGASALGGFHGSTQHRFTEEFQAEVYHHTLPMLGRIPNFRGTSPWILVDFRSPRRLLPHLQDGWNRKGLLTPDGTRKLSWKILKDFYESLSSNSAAP